MAVSFHCFQTTVNSANLLLVKSKILVTIKVLYSNSYWHSSNVNKIFHLFTFNFSEIYYVQGYQPAGNIIVITVIATVT